MAGYVYDLAQLIHQQQVAPVTILAHSLGGHIVLRYTGIYPEKVKKLIAIEGLGPSPKLLAERAQQTIDERMRRWIDYQRGLAGRVPRRYATIEEAFKRMQEANRHLSPEQARHLTQHGVNQNEDGTYSWKFDNYVRAWPPYDMTDAEVTQLWERITCPSLLVYGKESWASNPLEDGRADHFRTARVVAFEKAGHWVHHDQLDAFIDTVRSFLGET
jgi:pimeloyl-ACP methyl ester carboxylesterase